MPLARRMKIGGVLAPRNWFQETEEYQNTPDDPDRTQDRVQHEVKVESEWVGVALRPVGSKSRTPGKLDSRVTG